MPARRDHRRDPRVRHSSSLRWTDEDRELIRLLVERGVTVPEMVPCFPGRTAGAVYMEVLRLGLRLRNNWSDFEIAMIRRFAATHTAAEIGVMLGRTPKATHYKAEEQGIKFTHGRSGGRRP